MFQLHPQAQAASFSYQQPTHRSAEVTQGTSTKGLFNGLVEHSMCRLVCSHRCHFLHSSAFSRSAHSVPPHPMAAAMRQQGQALPEQLLLAEHRTQVWNQHSMGTQGLWAQDRLFQQGRADLVTWRSSCCCHEPLGEHRQPSGCLSMLGFALEFQLPAQLPHNCQSRAGASPTDDPPVPSEGQHSGFWARWCGGKSHVVVGAPHPGSRRGRASSATLQPAGGASGAAGSSRSGRRCWWPSPRGKR